MIEEQIGKLLKFSNSYELGQTNILNSCAVHKKELYTLCFCSNLFN